MPILDSVIGAGAQLGSSIINSISANAMQKKQFAQQQELYDKQFEQQKQMIAEQNAYNSPANQRKLLEDAGLNPMLMYQNGTSNSIQSEVAKPEVAQAPLPIGAGSAIATGIDKSLQTMMSLAQIRQLEANTKKTEAETEGQNISNKFNPLLFEQDLKKGEVSIENIKAGTDNLVKDLEVKSASISQIVATTSLTQAQVREVMSRIPINEQKAIAAELELEGIRANNSLIAAKYEYQQLVNGAFALNTVLHQESMRADIKLKGSQSSLNDSNRFLIDVKQLEQAWRSKFILDNNFTPESQLWQRVLGMLSADAPAPDPEGDLGHYLEHKNDSTFIQYLNRRPGPYSRGREIYRQNGGK